MWPAYPLDSPLEESFHTLNRQGRSTTPGPLQPSSVRTSLNQLPLLRLRTQATTYIPSHLHFHNSNTYTPHAKWYCPSCLPLQTPAGGNETHTLVHRPYFSPLAQPAIQGLMLQSLMQISRDLHNVGCHGRHLILF